MRRDVIWLVVVVALVASGMLLSRPQPAAMPPAPTPATLPSAMGAEPYAPPPSAAVTRRSSPSPRAVAVGGISDSQDGTTGVPILGNGAQHGTPSEAPPQQYDAQDGTPSEAPPQQYDAQHGTPPEAPVRIVGPPAPRLVLNQAPSGGNLQPGQFDVMGVRLGMSREQVARITGPPLQTPGQDNATAATWRYRWDPKNRPLMNVTFDDGGTVYWINGLAVSKGGKPFLRMGDPASKLGPLLGKPAGRGEGFLMFRNGEELLRVSIDAENSTVTILTIGGRVSF